MTNGSLNCREEMVLKVAEKLLDLPVESLDEATIDCNFLFRFDPLWSNKIGFLRSMIWILIGGPANIQPFNRENSFHRQWAIHLDANKNVTVGFSSSSGLTISNGQQQGYSPFKKELTTVLMNSESKLDQEKVWNKIWQEANQISKFHSELNRIGIVFDVIPNDTEFDDYSPKQIRTFFNSVFDWVMWGLHVPTFRWEMSQFIENKNDSMQWVRPTWWPTGHWKDLKDGGRVRIPHKLGNTKRMTLLVRSRTWAIYYLTKRGGGEQTENKAVDIWNNCFPNMFVKPTHFRNERTRLLKNGSKKNAQLVPPYLGLSAW